MLRFDTDVVDVALAQPVPLDKDKVMGSVAARSSAAFIPHSVFTVLQFLVPNLVFSFASK